MRTTPATSTRILFDPQGVLARELGTEPATAHPAHPPFFEQGDPAYAHWFLWMFRQVYGWAKRAAQGDRRAVDNLFDAGASLQAIRASLLQMRRWTLGSMDYVGVTDPQTAEELARTYGPLSPAEVLTATRRLLVVYERICPAYCAKAGTPYPSALVAVLEHILDQFDALS